MKSMNTLLLAAALSALTAGLAAATPADLALDEAFERARATLAASPAKPVASCADARELETSFELAIAFRGGVEPKVMTFDYAGCSEEGRNDYLPAYTERSYKGADGFGLTIVTNDGASASEVLVSKGKDWIGQYASLSNAALVSGDPVSAGVLTLKEAAAERRGLASVRNAVKPLYPQLNKCEAVDWSKASGSGAPSREGGRPAMGFGRGGPSLVLLTASSAYYYHEDCDICAEVTKCDLASGRLSSQIAAHMVGCDDLKAPRSEPGVVYDACADSR